MKVHGLDWSNSNAEARAIVIHNAWYAEPDMIAQHGKLGRSEGCFAFSRASQWDVMSPRRRPHDLRRQDRLIVLISEEERAWERSRGPFLLVSARQPCLAGLAGSSLAPRYSAPQ